jgi:midasin (ATPase involved in ribosome maturation)
LERQLSEMLVLLMEVLRRLECKYVVARFGSRSNLVLKELDEPFSEQKGEQILSSFSFNEGTLPCTALVALTDNVWGQKKKPKNTHQLVLMITDGNKTKYR